MEVIGCAASVSQLLVYVTASAFRLHSLCSVLRRGDSIYRDEETNISLLLSILHRLPGQDKQADDPIFPILLSISGFASQALHLLQPRTFCGINWTPLISQDKIQLAFQSLDKQRRLLHLYISQAHHEALLDLRETIDKSSMANSGGTFPENPMESTESPGSTSTPATPATPATSATPATTGYVPLPPTAASSNTTTTPASTYSTPTQAAPPPRTVFKVSTHIQQSTI